MQCVDLHVALLSQPTYASPHLDRAVDQLLAPVFPAGRCRTARVLLKPNLISATNGRLACTNPRVIAAVAQWFVDQGARVVVGDSPAFGTARSVLRRTGALQPLTTLGAEVVEFRRRRLVELPSGYRARVAAAALECDYLINLPKVKAHSQMRITLAVKNYFGCMAGLHKPWWHMVHGGPRGRFADLLVDLLSVLPAGFSLVDGIEAMHGTGPIHGQPYPLGLLAGGVNPVAVDTALQAALGVADHRCPLWCAARKAGVAGTVMKHLIFSRAHPDAVAVKGFIVPEELAPVRFNPFRFVKSSLLRLSLCLRGL
ncbi:DUF362 domain-containing protein [Desulfobulbus propionicus]|jgi:uncharacterized protein (DUF362 family)